MLVRKFKFCLIHIYSLFALDTAWVIYNTLNRIIVNHAELTTMND